MVEIESLLDGEWVGKFGRACAKYDEIFEKLGERVENDYNDLEKVEFVASFYPIGAQGIDYRKIILSFTFEALNEHERARAILSILSFLQADQSVLVDITLGGHSQTHLFQATFKRAFSTAIKSTYSMSLGGKLKYQDQQWFKNLIDKEDGKEEENGYNAIYKDDKVIPYFLAARGPNGGQITIDEYLSFLIGKLRTDKNFGDKILKLIQEGKIEIYYVQHQIGNKDKNEVARRIFIRLPPKGS